MERKGGWLKIGDYVLYVTAEEMDRLRRFFWSEQIAELVAALGGRVSALEGE